MEYYRGESIQKFGRRLEAPGLRAYKKSRLTREHELRGAADLRLDKGDASPAHPARQGLTPVRVAGRTVDDELQSTSGRRQEP